MSQARVLVIAGMTAAGKTELGLAAALALGGEVISADSAAVFRGLDIGTGKPTAADRRLVRHHCLDLRDPGQPFSVAEYRAAALEALGGCAARGRVPVLVGGSGLYIRAVLEQAALPPAPPDPALRAELEELAAADLHARLRRVDPETAARLHPADRRRVIRALEVHAGTGRPLSAFRHAAPPARRRHLLLVFDRPPAVLRARIARRVDRMLEAGLVGEVAGLLDAGVSPEAQCMQAVGYRQTVAHLRAQGGASAAALRGAIVTATTRFAKRQRTWFRREPGAIWVDLGSDPAAAALPRVVELWRGGTGPVEGAPPRA